ncbi:hypothetical protein [Bufonid herpesvirus 1]|uniref:hypothetical protein n=1 Tax=Bufonid herpesvirus 1 TaxID=2282206 RepID=UPI000EB6F41D|nr:hypothetical protein [Bufonid herpesvirus 1]AXF48649.1 hypothetical protein [Bufonid herpesvirus 1]
MSCSEVLSYAFQCKLVEKCKSVMHQPSICIRGMKPIGCKQAGLIPPSGVRPFCPHPMDLKVVWFAPPSGVRLSGSSGRLRLVVCGYRGLWAVSA